MEVIAAFILINLLFAKVLGSEKHLNIFKFAHLQINSPPDPGPQKYPVGFQYQHSFGSDHQ